jgi:hypothetical protein
MARINPSLSAIYTKGSAKGGAFFVSDTNSGFGFVIPTFGREVKVYELLNICRSMAT